MLSVLVIDDGEDSREGLRERLLDRADISEVRCASNALEAFETLEDFVPDAIILDVVMPMLDGLETLRRLRFEKRFDSTAVIMMSSIMLDHVARQALNSGADVCLWKPVSAETAYECVKKAVLRRTRAPGGSVADDEALRRQSIALRLRDIGADEGQDGYEYLLEGIMLACSLKYIHEIKLVSSIYEAIAVKRDTTASRVERNMRETIKRAWEKDPEKMSKMLCVNRKPTTGDVIAKIAHMTRYWL